MIHKFKFEPRYVIVSIQQASSRTTFSLSKEWVTPEIIVLCSELCWYYLKHKNTRKGDSKRIFFYIKITFLKSALIRIWKNNYFQVSKNGFSIFGNDKLRKNNNIHIS